MPTLTQPVSNQPLPIRPRHEAPRENVSEGFLFALTLHAAVVGIGIAWALIANIRPSSWGENSLQSGSISATMGETAGVRIPEAIQQVKNGTASITMDDRSFGQRYAYYARIVDQKVSESWNTQQIFPGATSGMRAVVVFTINADGTPSDPRIVTKSGSAAFDTLALRTIQRIDGFGPLPQTKPITVQFALDYKQP